MEEEENYQQQLRDYEKNEKVSDSSSNRGVNRALSWQPLSITLMAEDDIIVSGNSDILNFKDDKHPEEIQNL
jgi:hypothetical protein